MNLSAPTIVLLAWLAACNAWAASSDAGIYRCVGDDDVQVFTDRPCGALGVRDHTTESAPQAVITLPLSKHGCSRRIDIFQAQVQHALESQDVNRLSGLYHWIEDTRESADILMPELQVISRRQLISIEVESLESDGGEHPVRLWLAQYVSERPGQTIHTDFKLVMNAGCWWLHRT